MTVELKQHNKEAYEKVVEGFQNKNRIAVVEPPGTGKSFIALKWLEESKDMKTLLLVPSYSIIVQYEEHIKACGYELIDFPNLIIMTYSTLMSEVKKGIIPKVDQIILDEFHRCGAPEWGKGVQALLEENKDSKVLGLSATPIRYLDKNRDMSDEIFDGNVVFQMDLTEAVARGILQFPLYINGIYKLDSDIKTYEKKISNLNNNSLKEKLTEKLELAKRRLEQATKLDELFHKYMKKKNSKNIIFCKDKKHMDQMIEESYKWFSKVNSEIDIYSVHYGKCNNEAVLREFYYSNNSHLKLLFCIDMLNEGFHDPNIDNIIMLRPTISPNLFIQQLGRGLALGNINVTIYDIVNNSKSNKDIKEFLDKVRKKREQLEKENRIDENESKKIENFEILEEVREVLDTLNDIEDMLRTYTSKEYKICLIEEFYKINNRLPKQNEKYKGVALGKFLVNIKNKNIRLTKEQIDRLLSLGFKMEIKNIEKEKEYKICLIEEFYRENGRLPKCAEKYKNVTIGSFLRSIKAGDTKITGEQMNRLLSLGFVMEIKNMEQKKEYKISLVEEFYKEKERLPKQGEIYKEENIGNFLSSIKRENTSITKDQKSRLENIGFKLEYADTEKIKEEKVKLVEEFHKEKGRLPQRREKYKGTKIGAFLNCIKRGESNITEDQMKRLQKMGFNEEISINRAERGVEKLEQFYREKGRLPYENETYHDMKLGNFLNRVIQGKVNITEKQKKRLNLIGIKLEIVKIENDREIDKEGKIKLVEEFYSEKRRLPYQKEKYHEIALGAFLRCIKRGETKITEDQMRRLIKIGFSIDPKFVRIDSSIKNIEKFYEEKGRLPEAGEQLDIEIARVGDVLLSIKLGEIRITEEQFLRLQSMGFKLEKGVTLLPKKEPVLVKKRKR
ncbi:MAG: DEAD/DEAH box helicase family protein [Bacilli bacterium]|nr:DEAD/DEAH box helicase family protein [Bacilli bacterium]